MPKIQNKYSNFRDSNNLCVQIHENTLLQKSRFFNVFYKTSFENQSFISKIAITNLNNKILSIPETKTNKNSPEII